MEFGVTPKIDLNGYNANAGYDKDGYGHGSKVSGGYPFDINSLNPTKHLDTVDYIIGDCLVVGIKILNTILLHRNLSLSGDGMM